MFECSSSIQKQPMFSYAIFCEFTGRGPKSLSGLVCTVDRIYLGHSLIRTECQEQIMNINNFTSVLPFYRSKSC